MWKYASSIVLALLLGGGGMYWYSSTAQRRSANVSPAAACEHSLPTAECPFCSPAIIAELGHCAEHDVPEALCWICRPQLVAAFKSRGDWCGGHDRPESLCPICKGSCNETPSAAAPPPPAPAPLIIAGTTPSPTDSLSPASLARSQQPPSPACTRTRTRVQLASPEVAAHAGLRYVELAPRPITHWLTCNAEVAYDANRFAHLASRVPGIVREVPADLGRAVRRGDVLARIDSPELAAAKADLLQASASVALCQQNVARESALAEKGLTAQRDLLELETRLAEARISLSRAAQRLRALGLTEREIAAVVDDRDTQSLLALTAPFDGLIVRRDAVLGESVDTARPLFSIADTSRMWALLDVADPGAPVAPGRRVRLYLDDLDGRIFDGTLTWVSTELDPRTRTLRARAEFDNPDGLLRAHMFGRADVLLHDNETLLVVPRAGVQWDGCCNVVFVRESDTTFIPRQVRLGPAHDDVYEVRSGLTAGETVVADGSFLLKTEILKGEIGAGCCADDAKK